MDISSLKKLFFIHHSTYLFVDYSRCWMLFDFYTHSEKVLHHLQSAPTLPLYIFCSHSHADHFSPEVFSAFEAHEGEIHFIFHDEVRPKVPSIYRSKVEFLQTGETLSTPLLQVKAYGSTDLGGSFLITSNDGFTTFYAGDLNFWHWNQEASPKYIAQYQVMWETELERIQTDHPSVDLLMFPTDLRLGPDFLLGLRQFIEAIPTKMLAPMHLNGVPSSTDEWWNLGLHLLPDALSSSD